MIEIKMTGMCEGCKNADLQVCCYEADYGEKPMRQWDITCRHYLACRAVWKKAKGEAEA